VKKFWNWIHDDSGGRVLRLEGPIDSESFWGDEITPQAFRDELYAEEGDITLWLNSPGGNVFAAAEIYTMLRDYPGKVTVRIASIAASAASVVAMSGDLVQMSPTALLFIHDPMTIAMGNTKDMEKAITTLNEVKESIINAYAAKTGLTRNRIGKLMSEETWLNARKAVDLGFADEILFEDKKDPADADPKKDDPDEDDPEKPEEQADDPDKEGGDEDGEEQEGKKKPFTQGTANAVWQYSSKLMGETILNRLGADCKPESEEPGPAATVQAQEPPEAGVTPEGDTLTEDAVSREDAVPAVDTPSAEAEKPPMEDRPEAPVIGMDGRTENGDMPYELLKKQLEFLR
jgi:ATP-dependent Clp protease protease subunit